MTISSVPSSPAGIPPRGPQVDSRAKNAAPQKGPEAATLDLAQMSPESLSQMLQGLPSVVGGLQQTYSSGSPSVSSALAGGEAARPSKGTARKVSAGLAPGRVALKHSAHRAGLASRP